MKKSLFSKGVFKEMFCQMKMVGILASVLYALAGILYPVGLIVERYEYKTMEGYVPVEEIFPAEYFYVIYGLVFVFAPLLIDIAFSFLEKRNACDYYHALPVKRSTLYISSLAAVFAWVGIIYTVATGFTFAIAGIDSYMMLDMLAIGKILLKSFVGCIFVMGICCLGVSLTGTKISTALVIILILVGPRSILGIIQTIIEEQIPFAVVGYGNSLTNHGYNIVFNIIFGSEYTTGLPYVAPLIYSSIIGIIYMIFGGLIFVKRKSESAGQSTVHPAIQVVCRIVPAFLCALMAIWLFIENTIGGEDDPMTYFGVVVLLIISLIIYFVYDLITNRKFKSFVKSIKQLPIFLGLVVVASIALMIYINNEKEWRPDTDEIESLEFYKVDYLYSFLGVEKIKVEDEEIYKVIEEAYARQVDKELSEDYYIYDEVTDTYYQDVQFNYQEELVVGIKENGVSRYRRIFFLKEEYDMVVKACANVMEEEGKNIKLPRYDTTYTYIDSGHITLREAAKNNLYNCLKEELETVNWSDILVIDESWIDYIYISIESNRGECRNIHIPITDELPKTKALLLEQAYENANMKDVYSEIQDKDYMEKWIENYNISNQPTQLDFYYLTTNAAVDKQAYVSMCNGLDDGETKKWFELLAKVIEEDKDKDSADNKVILYMNMDIHDMDEYGEYIALDVDEEYVSYYISVTVAYKVSEETAKEFIDFIDDFKWLTEEDRGIVYEYVE